MGILTMRNIVRIRACQPARSARERGMPDLLDTDAHGFAATRMVRVKVSRRGAPLGFQRCYMKPGNLTFPPQWRDVGSEEHDLLMGNYVRRKARGEDMRQDVRADGTGMGVCPKPRADDEEEVGGVIARRHPRKKLKAANV